MKKIISLFLCITLLILLLPTQGFPVFATTYTGTCGENLTWEYDSDTGTLTISGTGAMSDYSSSSYNGTYVTTAPWRSFYQSMRTVVINNGVTSIGYASFRGCSELTSVMIPNSVALIGNSAFYNCTDVTNITIPDTVNSIGDSAFCGCTGLTKIIIPDSVTSIGYRAFSGCSSLTEITLPFVGKRRYSPSDMFQYPFGYIFGPDSYIGGTATKQKYYCSSTSGVSNETFYIPSKLKKVTISSCEYIQYGAFSSCTGLTSITIGNTITSIGDYAFSSCSGLTSITIDDGVSSIGKYAFYACTKLKNITIPNSVTLIGASAFLDCTGLTSIIIPDGLTTICSDTFYGCKGLKSINIPNSVAFIGDSAFYGCAGLNSINIPDSVTTMGRSLFFDCTNLINVTIGNGITTIGDNTFYNCSKLENITITDNVTYVSNCAFYGCNNLKHVYYGGKTRKVKCGSDNDNLINASWHYECKYHFENIYYVINDNESITITCAENDVTNLIIPETIQGYSVTAIGDYAFQNCSELTCITIPDCVISIGYSAFSGCSSLIEITLPFVGDKRHNPNDTYQYPFGYIFGINSYAGGTDTKQRYYGSSTLNLTNSTYYIPSKLKIVTISGCDYISFGAFSACAEITNVTIGNGVTEIGSNAFRDCSSLKSITIPDSVTTMGGSVFYGCNRLESITIPDSVTSIGTSTFRDCTGLISATIGNGVKTIGAFAFDGCESLTSVIIGNGVTTIEYFAFQDCTSLTTIALSDSIKYKGTDAFGSGECPIKNLIILDGSNIVNSEMLVSGSKLENVFIPDSVKAISSSAFANCKRLKNVCFCGTEEQWDSISIGSNNAQLDSASRTYHSCDNWNVRIYPTCTEEGSEYGICSVCGKEVTRKVNALGHIGGTATCYNKAICERCGDEYGEYTHTGEAEIRDYYPATCCENGYTGDTYCLGCGTKIATGESIPALGHRFTDYISNKDATCTADGTKTAKCDHCDATDTVTDTDSKLGHNYVGVVTNSTCTEQGYTTHTCIRCGDSYVSDYTDAISHVSGNWQSDNNTHWHSCTICGEKFDETTHLPTNWIVDIEPTNYTNGQRHKECTICGKILQTEMIPDVHIPGDINDDGKVNNKDLTRLFQYLSDWDVTVNEAALDVNGDGKVNNKDLTRLFQYLSDWDVKIF